MTTGLIPGGLLVAIEGIDGAGKTTLARDLAAGLAAHGILVETSKEPTQGPWGTALRQSALQGRLSPEEEVRLLLLDRRQHVEELIKPALAAGAVVILDRYYPSMVAYQGAHGLSVSRLLQDNAFAPAPDLTLLLDLEPSTGLARIRARGDKPNFFETEDNLKRCRAIFLDMQLPSRVVIDASNDAAEVLRTTWKAVIKAARDKLGQQLPDQGLAARLLSLEAATPA